MTLQIIEARLIKPRCLPLLVGSLPMEDHQKATGLMLEHTPEIPLWVQLPRHLKRAWYFNLPRECPD
ncbi:hypothetical protein [Desulfocicer vacuolatum]|uniref:hypothetical protein n=1 Tax=Desulfocicer vacuolatum TaxID=2298 RepID=UPI001E59CB4C|nr:hypothetical protein [Desulfocicer vacuolatum]